MKQIIELRPQQRLAMTMAMQSALKILQMGSMDLNDFLQKEIEQNPLLENRPPKAVKQSEFLYEIPARISLLEGVFAQAREAFSEKEDLIIAETLIAELDLRGYLVTPLDLIANDLQVTGDQLMRVLETIHTFEPLGIGARDLQECLLLQLQDKKNSILYRIIKNHFLDLREGRMKELWKKISIPSIHDQNKILKELRKLYFHPLKSNESEPSLPLKADILIKKHKNRWIVELNKNALYSFHFNPKYSQLLKSDISNEEKKTLRSFIEKGRWLRQSMQRRDQILIQIAKYIVKRQQGFLNGTEHLAILTANEIALDLELNNSTIARALSNKYIATPFGIKPLRFFLSHALVNEQGEKRSSKETVAALQKILENENTPLSDQQIANTLKTQGFQCSRRTVTKYRKLLKIGSKKKRLNF